MAKIIELIGYSFTDNVLHHDRLLADLTKDIKLFDEKFSAIHYLNTDCILYFDTFKLDSNQADDFLKIILKKEKRSAKNDDIKSKEAKYVIDKMNENNFIIINFNRLCPIVTNKYTIAELIKLINN